MTKFNTTMRNIALASTLVVASLGSSAGAAELSTKAKQQLFEVLGNAFSNQVSQVITEVNWDIEQSIQQSAINLGQPQEFTNTKVKVTIEPQKEKAPK